MPEADAIITCPKPPPDMLDLVKSEKKSNKLNKIKKAEMKTSYLLNANKKLKDEENVVMKEKYEEKKI